MGYVIFCIGCAALVPYLLYLSIKENDKGGKLAIGLACLASGVAAYCLCMLVL